MSRGDIFEPSDKLSQEEGFNYRNFEWTGHYGDNRFEEIAGKYFDNNPIDFSVKNISVSRLGDLKIRLINGFILEISPDILGNEECWRFFEIDSEEHIVVSGQGLEQDDDGANDFSETE